MTDLTGKKLPTVEQVEEIMKEWGKSVLRGLPFSFFMVYVMNEIQFQVVLMARYIEFTT